MSGARTLAAALWLAAGLAVYPYASASDPRLAAGAAPVTVFAAASLAEAIESVERELGRAGPRSRFSFAASSVLARQIEAGAPADIFASANERWMDRLEERSLLEPGTRTPLLGNRLVLIAPASSSFAVEALERGAQLAPALGRGARLAIGDVEHVPAGIYGRQALEHLGLWPQVSGRLALTDNVRGALALVERGEAALGVVYATDARLARAVRVVATFPVTSHDPIRYPFAVLRGRANRDVLRVFERLTGAAAIRVYQRFGFKAPGGEAARAH